MSDYMVRAFREGDEAGIVGLFNEVYGGYGGFVPRTVEYWRWCCLQRPDVRVDGVFVASDGGRLCGYAVVGVSGSVWEFCVADGDGKVAEVLLGEVVRYLEGLGASSVNVNVPRDACVVESLRKAGFGEVPAERMFVSTLNVAGLISALAVPQRVKLEGGFEGVFGFRLRDAPFGVGSEFSVKIRGGDVEVVESFSAEASVVVELGFMDLLSVLFNGASAGHLFLSGKVRVKPFWKFGTVLRFLSAVRLKGSWYFPLADFG